MNKVIKIIQEKERREIFLDICIFFSFMFFFISFYSVELSLDLN